MCDTLRNTRSRGRSGVPLIRLRWRSEIRFWRSFVVFIFIKSVSSCQLPVASCLRCLSGNWSLVTGYFSCDWLLRSSLSGLLLEHFTRVADALLLVGVGLAHRADVGGHLADQLPVDAGHRDVRLLVDRDLDPAGDVEDDRMRVAEREDDLLALHFGTVPDTDDVEVLAEAVGHALHRV